MSTKNVICFNKDFSLYQEIFQYDDIYLSIDNCDVEFVKNNNFSNTTIKIPYSLFVNIIEQYEKNKHLINKEEEEKLLDSKFIDLFKIES